MLVTDVLQGFIRPRKLVTASGGYIWWIATLCRDLETAVKTSGFQFALSAREANGWERYNAVVYGISPVVL